MAFLKYTIGENTEAVTLPKDQKVTIGGDESNLLCVLDDPSISPHHCEIVYDNHSKHFILRDVSEFFGTEVNGDLLRNSAVFLKHNDHIKAGSLEITYLDLDEHNLTESRGIVRMSGEEGVVSDEGGLDDASLSESVSDDESVNLLLDRGTGGTGLELDKFPPGAVFGNYNIVRLLGVGHNNAVYLANQETLRRIVALKFFPNVSMSAERQFLSVIQAAGIINHPNIIPYFDAGTTEHFVYLAMPFLSEGNLNERVAKEPFSEAKALRMIKVLAGALDQAHGSHNLPHGNIKGSNILFDDVNKVMLSDFGLASWIFRFGGRGDPWLTGSAAYCPPERALGMKVDWSGDQYALGIVLYQMVSGKLPFTGSDESQVARMQVEKKLPNPKKKNPSCNVSDATLQLIAKMCEKDPRNRFSSWSALLAAIDKRVQQAQSAAEAAKKKKFDGSKSQRIPANVLSGTASQRMSTSQILSKSQRVHIANADPTKSQRISLGSKSQRIKNPSTKTVTNIKIDEAVKKVAKEKQQDSAKTTRKKKLFFKK